MVNFPYKKMPTYVDDSLQKKFLLTTVARKSRLVQCLPQRIVEPAPCNYPVAW